MSISAGIMYTLALLFQPVRPTRRPAMHPDSTCYPSTLQCRSPSRIPVALVSVRPGLPDNLGRILICNVGVCVKV